MRQMMSELNKCAHVSLSDVEIQLAGCPILKLIRHLRRSICFFSSRHMLGQEGLGFYDGFEWDEFGVMKCLTWSLAIERPSYPPGMT